MIACQFLNKPIVIVKRSYIEILMYVGPKQFWWRWKPYSKGYKFVFHEDFSISMFTMLKWAVKRNTKDVPESLDWTLIRYICIRTRCCIILNTYSIPNVPE
jgi:hypothetical protein